MKVEVVPRSYCACALKPGQVKRVPAEPTFKLFGYYVCCPGCGWKQNTVLAEAVSSEDPLTCAPFKCVYCFAVVTVSGGEVHSKPVWDQVQETAATSSKPPA